jgi:hypothetical protein
MANLLQWRRVLELELVAYRTPLGRLEFLWLGPAGFVTGPMAGTSPYLDWYLETFYVNLLPLKQ